ncbi:dienelactone hydrolase family protein [Terrilactibacillus sp. S3-3]|nr:dienelactone hydrolase family protein [Terrilactibacillus sp. S3-3]
MLGFSVGATIAWLCSENKACDFAIGCYGSRIRYYTDIKPLCPVLLIFPTDEKSFDIQALIKVLENKHAGNLDIRIFPGSHGFIDRFSEHFHVESADKALQYIDSFLEHAGSLSPSSE